MAGEGIREKLGDKTVLKSYNISKTDHNDMITDIFRSRLVFVGSPTVSNSILHSVAGFLHLVKELKFKKKKAACFGCYGWSGEGVKVLNKLMEEAGFEVISEGFRNHWNADSENIQQAKEFSKSLV